MRKLGLRPNGASGAIVQYPSLTITDLRVSYGSTPALQGVSLVVPPRTIVAMLGPCGAGKTALLQAVSGILRPSAGSISFDGQQLERHSAANAVRLGIVQVPEGRRLFSRLTVAENLRLGAYSRSDSKHLDADVERVCSYFPRLRERRHHSADSLSGGEQQMLAIGRALMARPKLLLVDEPSRGLAPPIVRDIFGVLKTINTDQGLAILVVERNVSVALEIAEYGYVLETGRLVVSDTAERLRTDDALRQTYSAY